ncbi:MAG: peptidoglycan DD-metalloendopeptidase family protein [Bdellovibrionaceae bacterium]|nr:peptidoglycan DD-metalloendopeptidase family protein [Pseudobdellovibrionaceae bacterium]
MIGTSAHAEIPAKDPGLQKIAHDIKIAKDNLEIQDLKQRKVLTALYSINRNLKRLVTEKSELGQQKSMVQLEIEGLNQRITDHDHQAELQKAQLTERLRAIYKLRGPTLARFLFGAKSSADLERNLKILGIVAQRDSQLIKNFREAVKDMQYRKTKLTQKLSSLQSLESELQNHEIKLQTEVSQKSKILSGIKRTKMFTQDKIRNLKDKSLSYDLADSGLIDMLMRPSFEAQKGLLPRPAQGPVSKQFGLVKQNDQPYVLSNKGLLIAAPFGSPVRAVFSGVVSFVGSLPGLGQVLILDHGDHYYTVYGYNASVRVQLGQEIAQAQIIASSGKSNFDQVNGLYFEVRHFSEPYNPMEWVKGFSL